MTRPTRRSLEHLLWLLVGWSIPASDRNELREELRTLYRHRARERGATRANLWLVRNVTAFAIVRAFDGIRSVAGSAARSVGLVGQDLRFAARALRNRPGYTASTIATIGVGVGGIAAVFAVTHWVLLRPVPGLTGQDQLATIRMEMGQGSPAFPVSHPDLLDLAVRIPMLAELAASSGVDVHVQLTGDRMGSLRLRGAVVTENFFKVIGLTPTVGRASLSDDAVVISDRLWAEHWSRSADVLGRRLRINGYSFQVAAVAPAGFHGAELPGSEDVWLPATAWGIADPGQPTDVLRSRGHAVWTDMVGRLRPGTHAGEVNSAGAEAIEAIRNTASWPHSFGANFALNGYPGLGLAPRVRDKVERTLTLLAAVSGLLLLLALANASNLALVHGSTRTQALAVRSALGAPRSAIVRGTVLEQGLLGLGGSLAALGVAAVVTGLIRDLNVSPLGASIEGVSISSTTAAVTLAIASAVALLAGLGPVLSAYRHPKLEGRSRPARSAYRVQSALVVAQVGLSVMLLVGSALLTRTVAELRADHGGFDPSHIVRFSLDPVTQGYEAQATTDLLARAEREILTRSEVEAAGFVSPRPVSGSRYTLRLAVPQNEEDERAGIFGQFEATPGFFDAMRGSWLAGHSFGTEDLLAAGSGRDLPIVVSRGVVETLFPNRPAPSVVGEILTARDTEYRVVGVIDDIRLAGDELDTRPLVFLPWRGGYGFDVTGWIRTDRPSRIAAQLRPVVSSIDGNLPVFDVRPLRAQMDRLITRERLVSQLSLWLSGLGLVLVGLGLNGVLAYWVETRKREIGVRVSLGASSGRITGQLLRRGLGLAIAGCVVGFLGAATLAGALRSWLFGVGPFDPVSYGFTALAVLTVVALAVLSPVLRITRLDPTIPLRAE